MSLTQVLRATMRDMKWPKIPRRRLLAKRTVLARLVATGRASASDGDVLALGPPLGRRPTNRASRALARLRENRV